MCNLTYTSGGEMVRASDLRPKRSPVRIPAVVLSGNNRPLAIVVCTYVRPIVTKQYSTDTVPAKLKGRQLCPTSASQWPCVTDFQAGSFTSIHFRGLKVGRVMSVPPTVL